LAVGGEAFEDLVVGFLATTAPILIDDTDGAVFANKTEVPVF